MKKKGKRNFELKFYIMVCVFVWVVLFFLLRFLKKNNVFGDIVIVLCVLECLY